MLKKMGDNESESIRSGRKSSRREKLSLKYYASLDDEMELDPEIAIDMMRYLS